MKTAISIPDPVFEAAEKFAHRIGISRSQLYTKAVEEYLKEFQNQSVTKKLNEIYSTESSRLDRVDHTLQYLSLQKDNKWGHFPIFANAYLPIIHTPGLFPAYC